jgi:hypothetical protein
LRNTPLNMTRDRTSLVSTPSLGWAKVCNHAFTAPSRD